MPTDKFEEAFGAFLDSEEYDHSEEALFSLLRMAFLAGWRAAMKNKEEE